LRTKAVILFEKKLDIFAGKDVLFYGIK